jgi:uncharacterized protein YukE
MSTPIFPDKLPLNGHVLKTYAVMFKSAAMTLTRTAKDLDGVAPVPALEWQGVAADRFNAMVIQTTAASATIADILLQTANLFNQSADEVDGMCARLDAMSAAHAQSVQLAASATGTPLKMLRASVAEDEKKIAKLHADFLKLDTDLKARFHTAVAALQEAEKMLPFRPVRIAPSAVAPKPGSSPASHPELTAADKAAIQAAKGGKKPGDGSVITEKITAAESNAAEQEAIRKAIMSPSSHTVVAGDSWWGVSERELHRRHLPATGQTVQAYMREVQSANKGAVGKALLPGTVLAMPVPAAVGEALSRLPAPTTVTPKAVTPPPAPPRADHQAEQDAVRDAIRDKAATRPVQIPNPVPAQGTPQPIPHGAPSASQPSSLLRPAPAAPAEGAFTFDSLLLFRK